MRQDRAPADPPDASRRRRPGGTARKWRLRQDITASGSPAPNREPPAPAGYLPRTHMARCRAIGTRPATVLTVAGLLISGLSLAVSATDGRKRRTWRLVQHPYRAAPGGLSGLTWPAGGRIPRRVVTWWSVA